MSSVLKTTVTVTEHLGRYVVVDHWTFWNGITEDAFDINGP